MNYASMRIIFNIWFTNLACKLAVLCFSFNLVVHNRDWGSKRKLVFYQLRQNLKDVSFNFIRRVRFSSTAIHFLFHPCFTSDLSSLSSFVIFAS
jgi:hypothetical protein